MEKGLSILKGIHPGIVLERELAKRKLGRGRFAISVDEFPQTIGAIINGKRDMNAALALRIEQKLGLEEGFFMMLQVFYEIEVEKRKQRDKDPQAMPKLRSVLFWDTKPEMIDWQKQKKAVIRRVFEGGNDQEREEVTRFYGKETVEAIMKNKE
jgi:plasmid maintenance system antidote protein VapI